MKANYALSDSQRRWMQYLTLTLFIGSGVYLANVFPQGDGAKAADAATLAMIFTAIASSIVLRIEWFLALAFTVATVLPFRIAGESPWTAVLGSTMAVWMAATLMQNERELRTPYLTVVVTTAAAFTVWSWLIALKDPRAAGAMLLLLLGCLIALRIAPSKEVSHGQSAAVQKE